MSVYALRLGLIDVPSERSSHAAPTPRGGGIGLLFSVFAAACAGILPVYLWLPTTAVALISFYDDFKNLSVRVKLVSQLFAATFAAVGILYYHSLFPALMLLSVIVLFIVGTTNFYNFMDGINGLASLTGIVAFCFLAFFASMNGADKGIALSALVIAAASAGFLPFNLPSAKVFMGDVGSVLLGFLFSCLVVVEARGVADFLCLVSFLFPFYADGITTLFIRWQGGEPLTRAHRRHLYQVLCNELGKSHWQVTCGYVLLQILVSGLMLVCYRSGIGWQIAGLLLPGTAFVVAGQRARVRAVKKT